jgi:TonB family protein
MTATRWAALATVGLLFAFLVGCSGSTDPSAAPSGWNRTDTRLWKQGVDTSQVFRDMENLNTMGVGEPVALEPGGLSQEQFNQAIKESLMELFRANPDVVDSLFQAHATSKLENADLSGDAVQENGQLKPELLNKFKKQAYEAINENYREPSLTEGISGITYPDSLRTRENSGQVMLQVHIDTTGAVNAVEVVEGTHPILNAIAMKAATQTNWNPAYVKEGEQWVGREAWGRSPINFPAPRN